MTESSIVFRLPAGEDVPNEVNVFIEITKGSSNKIEFREHGDYFALDRVLTGPNFYPTDYGLIPQTWNTQDEDLLDAIVLVTYPTFPGCVIACRPVGLLHMEDSGEKDNKVICVPIKDPRWAHVQDIADVNAHTKAEIKTFMETYKLLEPGKHVTVTGFGDAAEAKAQITEAMAAFKAKFANS